MAQMGQVSSVSSGYEVERIIGRELTSTGFNMNFAPVLDLNLHSGQPGDSSTRDFAGSRPDLHPCQSDY